MGVRCCVVGSLLAGGSSPLGGGCSPLLPRFRLYLRRLI